ncbi:MAG: hypothetical protein C4317_03720 [Acidimicrobiia bacterium]
MMVEAPSRSHAIDLEGYAKAIVTYIDDDDYPMSVPADFRSGDSEASVVLDPISRPPDMHPGRRVTVIFSHIKPVEDFGYVDRRYLTVEGRLEPKGDVFEVKAERISGWDESVVPFFEYCERSVGRGRAYLESLSRTEGKEIQPRLPLLWKMFLATRAPFLTATVIPVLLGAAVARWQGYSASWFTAVALIGASLVHIGLNMLNDYFDSVSGADQMNVTPTPYSGGSRVLQYGLVSEKAMLGWGAGLMVAGCVIGVVLSVFRGPALLAIGGIGVLLAFFYTAPPLRLAYRGLGDLAVATGFGPIVVAGSYYVVARKLSIEALYASIPVAILVMLILYVNQVPDRNADALAGKNTVAVRFSREAILRGYAIAAAAAFLSVVIGVAIGLMPTLALLSLLPAPLAIVVYRGMRDNYDSPYGLMPAMSKNIALHGLVGTALTMAYFVSAYFSG